MLWTNELNFARGVVFNQHNQHYYSFENPYVIQERNHQHMFSVNLWAGTLENHLLGRIIFPNKLNGQDIRYP